ncbi:hypothetical protein ABES33_28440 [Bacillus pseudomycoides]|uniref:hypothetical protein n=1 Tax=Bacillus pseudomycoides TaxID=64104 RepID=UPI003D1E4789
MVKKTTDFSFNKYTEVTFGILKTLKNYENCRVAQKRSNRCRTPYEYRYSLLRDEENVGTQKGALLFSQ